ncbi:hypothetical protein UlMin_009261 [Ulmus minor]
MGEALFELEQVLRSKQHKLTPQETNALLNCKSKALKDYTVGAVVGGGVGWIASSKLSLFGRISIAAGASALVGLWRLGSSLDSCLDHILALDGSRMQKELVNIMVTKYWNDPWRMRLISKHFYSERVYDDSTSDLPKIRWRYRNFYSDNVPDSHRTHESDSHSDSQGHSHSDSQGDYNINSQSDSHTTRDDTRNDSDKRKFNYVSKQVPVYSGADAMADPLDCVFGYPPMEEIPQPKASSTSSKLHPRNHKRSHRRRRMRHQEVP